MTSSVVKEMVEAFAGPKTLALGSEMPETPGLKLCPGKISTATRKQIIPNGANRN
jgi:hypothetical protein